jgi:two-component system, OmpR family, response regulator
MPNGRNLANALIIDDDLALAQMLLEYLRQNGFRAEHLPGRDGVQQFCENFDPDIIILDLQLRNDDGLDLLREMRSRADVPTIIITGHRLEEIDRVVGLELGADDYVTKPFGMRELLARMRAVLRRRSAGLTQSSRKGENGKWRFEGWELRLRSRTLLNPAGESVPLTKGEYALLVAFLEAAGRPLSREQLLQATRIHEDIFDRSIDVQILRLRRKLEEKASMPQMIKTERGVGYVFAASVERS